MARKQKTARSLQNGTPSGDASRETEVRIIGGEFRGRRLRYHGDPVVRPMKHRTREAIFNLVGTECRGRHAIDLFAGTGALGLEAISRGAAATLIERHVPTARVVRENIASLGVEDRTTLLVTSTFLWAKRDLPAADAAPPADVPWVVFCSPPYAFFVDQLAAMADLVGRIIEHAPVGSTLVVEGDDRLDLERLQPAASDRAPLAWDVRHYAPAVIGIWRK